MISKVTQEQFAKLYREQYSLKIYCVRPFNHTGIGQRDSFVLPSFCKQVAEIDKSGKDGKIQVGNLKVKRDFSHATGVTIRLFLMIEFMLCLISYWAGKHPKIVIENPKEQLLDCIEEKIERVPSSYEKIAKRNNQLKCPSSHSNVRDTIFELYKQKGYSAIDQWYFKRLGIKRYAYKLWNYIPRKAQILIKKYYK